MYLLMTGCEYAGKTTQAAQIMAWAERTIGATAHFHDHHTIPSTELTPEAQESLLRLHPQAKEMFQRFMIEYHISPNFYTKPDHNLMAPFIEEAVYAPLYYGYGGEQSGAPVRSPAGQRSEMARKMERRILDLAPDVVLVLVKASPAAIRQRMRENPHPHQVVREQDVEYVLRRFEEEVAASLVQKRIVLDTTAATVAETLDQFVAAYEPFLTNEDLLRMRQRQAQ